MFASSVAARPFGDAVQMLVDMQGAAELTLKWADLDALELTRDEAFALGRHNSLQQMLHGIQMPVRTRGCDLRARGQQRLLPRRLPEVLDPGAPSSPVIAHLK